MKYEVKENFLDQRSFQLIKDTMLGNDFPWYYNGNKVSVEGSGPYDFQFTHNFYNGFNITSDYFPILEPFIEAIKPAAIVRIKANLTPRTPERVVYGYHTDYPNAKLLRTAVLYINSNDGATVFENGEEFKSVENRFVVFDSDSIHSGTSCTDEKVRCLININYYEWL